jgi:hypothetical protein
LSRSERRCSLADRRTGILILEKHCPDAWHPPRNGEMILRNDLQMRKINLNYLPYALDTSQKATRIDISWEILVFLENHTDRSLCSVYAREETGIYLCNFLEAMWIAADVAQPIRVWRTVIFRKLMFWINFSGTWIGAIVMLPPEQNLNKEFFTGIFLSRITENRAQTRPKLKARRNFVHLDKAWPHLTPEQYNDFGITRVPYLPYSQDLSPCDFWLFGYLKHYLEGWVSNDELALKA